jgi:tRNA (mo5U34)-methyltransferase
VLNYDALWRCFQDIGVDAWQQDIEVLIRTRLSETAHGDFASWRQTIEQLQTLSADQLQEIRDALIQLSPWRKGPFNVAGIEIDSEWRSDLKWVRIKDAIAPLAGRNILDVGCGNGYYAQQMSEAGAESVIGVDPTLLYVLQHLAVSVFQPARNVFVLPLRAEELPQNSRAFDSCFSMGVLYHQRSPLEHLRQLRGMLRPAGQLVLETIYLPGDESFARTPEDRYARMRNVWLLPTISELSIWLRRSGFKNIEIVDTSVTTVAEQRSTEWMSFESLAEALAPDDPSQTVEGWPAPHRVVVLANAP